MLPPLKARLGLVLLGIVWAGYGGVQAQTFAPQGSEFSISGPLNGDQVAPALGISPSGGYLVWQDNGIDLNGWGIGAIRLSASLSRNGEPFRVNTVQKGDQEKPSVALLSGGGAVIAWQSSGAGKGASNHVYARFIGPDGSFVTEDVQVEPNFSRTVRGYTTNMFGYRANRARNFRFRILESYREQRDRVQGPGVAALPDGGAVVVYSAWRRAQTNTSQLSRSVTLRGLRSITNDVLRKVTLRGDWGQEIFLQRFSATGQKVGGEALVNQFSTFDQRNPSVVTLPNGNLVVAWVSERTMANVLADPGEVQICGRLFSSAGIPVSDEFTINGMPGIAATPSVSALADSRFTVAWAQTDLHNRTNSWDVYARFFTADGTAQGEPFRVNSYVKFPQYAPRVASAGANQIVVWTSLLQDRSQEGVFGQFLSSGSPSGSERRINTEILSKQIDPVAAADGASRFLTAWSSFAGSTGFDILAQRYQTTQPEGFVFPAAVTSGRLEFVPATASSLSKSSAAGGPLRMSWVAEPGASYQLQISTNLITWNDVGTPQVAKESKDSVRIEATLPAAFYRVIRVP